MRVSLLLLFLPAFLFGQNKDDKDGMKAFNRGMKYYEAGNIDSTLIVWTEMVENKTGIGYDSYGNAFFNIPTLYWQQKNYPKAIEWYKKVIASDLRDNDETGSLMEPHTNYKHKSACALAGLYQLDSNYTQTLYWLGMADTVYRYWGFEGSATSISKKQAYLLGWKTEVLLKLKRKDEAVRGIVTELICAGSYLQNFFSTSEDTLLSMVEHTPFKNAIDAALDSAVIRQIGANEWIATFRLEGLVYSLPISKNYPDRDLPHYWRKLFPAMDETVDIAWLKKTVQDCSFYQLLSH